MQGATRRDWKDTVATSPVVLRWMCDSPRTRCAWRTTPYIYVARTSNNRVIMACELYCCLLPQCEALRICRSGFPIATIHPPPTSTKNRLKSFCEVGYANFRPNVFVAGKRMSMEILVGVGLHAWCPVALKRFVAFSKNGNVQENIYRLFNVKRLEQDIKSRCNPHFL